MANPIGRPHGLTPEVVEKARHYLMDGYKEIENIVPSIAGLGCYLGVNKATLYKWKNENISAEFNDTLDSILMKQEMLLINGGLSQQFSGTITKLMLANHGYSDSVNNNHTSSDGSMTPKPTRIELVGLTPNDDSES